MYAELFPVYWTANFVDWYHSGRKEVILWAMSELSV